ncbi:MAG: VWA domain-containing protein [Thermoplasmatota archaeon]
MRDLWAGGNVKKKDSTKRILGVSEAVGTVLLLGISVMLAGSIALWTSNIDEGEEGLYVDLWATVRATDLVIVHRGGDILEGRNTQIILSDPSGGTLTTGTYYSMSTGNDERWGSGEELVIDISDVAIPNLFKVTVTSVLQGGTSVVLLSNELYKSTVSGNLPDLAVTRIQIKEPDGTLTNTIYEDGLFMISVRVDNFGTGMDAVYLQEETGNRIRNLRIFDSDDPLVFDDVEYTHYTSSGNPILVGNPDHGILKNGEYMVFDFEWDVSPVTPRSLGIHSLNVKVIPVFSGELNYRNNYVERKFRVDKELTPILIHGPDPGIYDISFSNDAPNSGDEVTVTVIIQNSGDEPIIADHHVNLVVSTWEPIKMADYDFEITDWIMDYDGHYGNWRSDDNSFPITDDEEFPTCVRTDIVLLPGAYLFYYFTLEARVDVPGGEQWIYASIDGYRDNTEPQGISFENGDDPGDNKDIGKIQVLPRIMVVDDDGAATGSDSDMTSAVLESLVGAGVTVDRLYTAQKVSDLGVTRDAPAYRYNQAEIQAPAMEDYDIVIWVTGYGENQLTNVPKTVQTDPGGNIQEMMDFMDSRRYLMIVGTSPFDGFAPYFTSGETTSPTLPVTQEKTDASTFLYRYMGIQKLTIDLDLPITDPLYLYGTDGEPDSVTPSPGEGLDYTIELQTQISGNEGMTLFLPREIAIVEGPGFEIPVGVMTTDTQRGLPIPQYNVIRAWSTPDTDQNNAQYRSAVIAWNISEIKYLNEKIDLIANILKWFDWKVEVGRDLAITRMNLYIIEEESEGVWTNIPLDDETSPKYLDTVILEAYIRNNGPSVESTSIMFYVTGPDGVELPIIPNIPDPRFEMATEKYNNPHDIPSKIGQGGETMIYKLWLAVGVGTYTFRVVVDPFHLITEINEENNDISYSTSTITSFVTKNNILIVDDDSSLDNFDPLIPEATRSTRQIDYSGAGGEPSQIVKDAVTTLGYDFDDHTVETTYEGGLWAYDSGLSILDLKRFNSVIWVTGASGEADASVRETLANSDIIAMMKYLNGDYPEAKYLPEGHHENVMLIGSNLIHDLIQSNDLITYGLEDIFVYEFMEDYLGIQAQVPFQGSGSSMEGTLTGDYIDDIYMGIEYGLEDLTMDFHYEAIAPTPYFESSEPYILMDSRAALTTEDLLGTGRVISNQYKVEDELENRNFNVVLHSWEFTKAEHSTVETSLHELLYMPLHWFDTPELHPEIVGRSCKISVDEESPVIGSSYLIQTEIANVGGVSGGGTVRFMDGTTLIKSENVYLSPDKTTTLEAIWRPLFAGERTLTVWIDRYDDFDEVFDEFNNQPQISKSVLIFWDDMESGDSNWEHDSTKLLINGEGTLDYLGEPTYTNIDNTWGSMDGFHLNSGVSNPVVEDIYHSSPNSYYMYEPSQGEVVRNSLDLILVLDTSGSMDNGGWDDSIKDYQPIGNMKIAAKSIVDQLRDKDRVGIMTFKPDPITGNPSFSGFIYATDSGKTTLKSTIDGLTAGKYAPLWDSIGYSVKNLMSVVGTGAHQSVMVFTDGDDMGYWGLEDGSRYYCPGSISGQDYLDSTWGVLGGLSYPNLYNYDWQGTYSNEDVIRIYDDDTMTNGFWVDLSFPKRTGLIRAPVPIYTIGMGFVPHSQEKIDPLYHSNYWFTTEYDLRMISDTSKGSYRHINSHTEIRGVFQDMFDDIEAAAGGTRSSGGTRSIGPWTDGNEIARDKNIVTKEIDLRYADTATLSFNQKYNLKSGVNGGIVAIYHDHDDDPLTVPVWEYIQPDQPYTGNYHESSWGIIKDQVGNEIRWCWNGMSGGGTMGWDQVTVNLEDFLGKVIHVGFIYLHLEGGSGYGWFLDDVTVKITTEDTNPLKKAASTDSWSLKETSSPGVFSYSGTHAWFCGDPNNMNDLQDGIDNSLYSRQIDLTNVRTATLEAKVKFNIDTAPGRPPDGFRIEVSIDNKQTWVPLNLGVRSAWGVSGTGTDADDGVPGDGKSYTGLITDGNTENWVPIGTLTRVNSDLSAFTGNVINIRFRVVTNTDATHYADVNEFKGIYIDDVLITGESLVSTRGDLPVEEPSREKGWIEPGPVDITVEDGDVEEEMDGAPALHPVSVSPEDEGENVGRSIPAYLELLMAAPLAGVIFALVVIRKKERFQGE